MKPEQLSERTQVEFIGTELKLASTFLDVAATTNNSETRARNIANAWKALTSAEKAARKLSSVPARAKIEEMLASLEQRLQGMSADRTQRVQRRRSKASRRRPER